MKTSNPLIRNKYSKNRPAFYTSMIPGDGFKDVISGVNAVTSISGTRYGIVNGVVTQFAVNQPPIEDDGLRGCPAFTQYFLNNETPITQSITLAAGSYCLWIEGSGSATFNGLTATAGIPKVFTLASGFTGNCVITGTVTRCMLNSGLFPAPFSPTQGVTKSFVSEASTSTTGTSFDLDDVGLDRLKASLRGATVGLNLWINPTKSTPPWTDNGTYYVCDGSVTYSSVSSAAVQTGKFYEIEFTTGAVTSGQLIVYVGAQIVFQAVPTANTTYRLRNATLTTSANVAFSSGAGFIGQVRKDIIVKEIKSQGHLDLTIKTNSDSGWWANSSVFNILSLKKAAVSLIYINKDAGGAVTFRTTDGTNVASVSQVLNVGSTYKIAVDWGIHSTGQKIMITVNGVKSALADFSGSFGAQDLTFFYGNTVHAGWIVKDSLKIFERPRW